MKMTTIYQTLEDRDNTEEIQDHGPYFCSLKDENGNNKKGICEPWLGEGYYFWDTRIEDAKWWGQEVHRGSYIICKTQYNQNSELLFDIVGNISHQDDFNECAELIRKQRSLDKVSVPLVIGYLKKIKDFQYKAIRMCPNPSKKRTNDSAVVFPGEKASFSISRKVQICFFDKTLLTEPFEIAFRDDLSEEEDTTHIG